jgi:glutamate/tyrosine decarboxylase-like PLP-dependent enzyme
MSEIRDLLRQTAELAADYVESLGERPVFPDVTPEQLREALGGPLPEEPLDPSRVVNELVEHAEPGVVGIGSGRYFGFVIGGALPAALAADWLTSTWDQNAGIYPIGPSASVVEQVTRDWILELLGLPGASSAGFVTGTQLAHVTGLAAARWHVLEDVGWNVNRDGLGGAPPIRVLTGEQRHVTVDRALRLLGLGCPTTVPVDERGRMRADALADALSANAGPAIVCAQAGDVNTGEFDPLNEIADACENARAWLHVDGAFGIWAAVSPRFRHLTAGIERADSWTTDAHKWLNVPYDSGIVLCAHPESHRNAMTVTASYLIQDEGARRVRDAVDWVPEFSRRARGFAVYAALRSLGRSGLVDLVERCCDAAKQFAEAVVELPGAEVLNEVVLNQVLFRFESDERTDEALRLVQESGRAWMSGTTWQGRKAIRLSVSNWQTGDTEIEVVLDAFRGALQAGQAPAR